MSQYYIGYPPLLQLRHVKIYLAFYSSNNENFPQVFPFQTPHPPPYFPQVFPQVIHFLRSKTPSPHFPREKIKRTWDILGWSLTQNAAIHFVDQHCLYYCCLKKQLNLTKSKSSLDLVHIRLFLLLCGGGVAQQQEQFLALNITGQHSVDISLIKFKFQQLQGHIR